MIIISECLDTNMPIQYLELFFSVHDPVYNNCDISVKSGPEDVIEIWYRSTMQKNAGCSLTKRYNRLYIIMTLVRYC